MPSAIGNNELGNVVVNQNTHKIYTIFIAPQPTALNGPLDTVYEAVGNPCAVTCTPGQPLGPISSSTGPGIRRGQSHSPAPSSFHPVA